ncbi:TPA: T9SS type A sorting domain-containing protein, partial [Candidatus Poribacteria bacterium]|nr:T9SS type A sorting domain-containing protein [Candidatus Poribacteria bacterium]HEX30648.1 T9SS type A sorting domain-containing protein [Candidatus Poribacteria bacterium]
ILASSCAFTPGYGNLYNNITCTGASAVVTLQGNLTMDGNLLVELGTFKLNGKDATVGGDVTINPTATLDHSTGGNTLTVKGDWINYGSYKTKSGSPGIGSTLDLQGDLSGPVRLFIPGDAGDSNINYYINLRTSGNVKLTNPEGGVSILHFVGPYWTNRGVFTADDGSTVKLDGTDDTLDQYIHTAGAPGASMQVYNLITNNDDDNSTTLATDLEIHGLFQISADKEVITNVPGFEYRFTDTARVVVSGKWLVTGSPSSPVRLVGTPETENGTAAFQWPLQLNTSGRVDLDFVAIRDSNLIIHGGSLNGSNVDYTIYSLGNLSDSWGPYDPMPMPEVEVKTEVPKAFSLGDANGDGFVDLFDFNILASVFGTTDPRADFNGDGYVDLLDFSILAENFGREVGVSSSLTAAPESISLDTVHLSLVVPDKIHKGDVVEVAVVADSAAKAFTFSLDYDSSILKPVKVERGDLPKDTLFLIRDGRVFSASRSGVSLEGVIAKLRFKVIADGKSSDGIALREIQLVDGAGRLARLPEIHRALHTVPRKTRLLANYPNPFNPETWIPFELADDANVKVEIFDLSGRLIRLLDLGHVPAGHYVDRASAAYWDGRNSAGERVASGVYLYRFSAGDYSAVRRMVILK